MKDLKTLKWFRQKLYELLPKRRDATLDLIDALSSDQHAESVTQLSLSPFFRRKYNSITKVIKEFLHRDKLEDKNGITERVSVLCQSTIDQIADLIASLCEPPKNRVFFYLVLMRPPLRVLSQRPYQIRELSIFPTIRLVVNPLEWDTLIHC